MTMINALVFGIYSSAAVFVSIFIVGSIYQTLLNENQ